MKNKYVNNGNSAYDPVEQDYNFILKALSAKPEMLQAILHSSQLEAHEHTISALKKGMAIKPSIPEQLAQAEKRYQAALDKQAEALFTLYQKLPIDRKIDLLTYAEEIGEINDKARKLASKQMQADRAEAIALHKAEIANRQTTVKDTRQASGSLATTALIPDSQSASDTGSANSITQAPHEKGLINQVVLGGPAAITVNFPFTVIPGLPALSKILEKIDKTTHFDLGFTFKGVADREPNPNGGQDILYRLSYAGAGIMSSKFNVQVSPIALKLEESSDKEKWGGSASLFTRQHSDGLGSKVTLNFNDSDAGLSYAHEYSYQKPSNKFISTLTGGKHFSNNSPAIRIPATYVPTIDRIASALPDKEEANVIFDRIDKVIPINQAFNIASSVVDKIAALTNSEQPSITAAKFLMHQKVIESGLAAKDQANVFAKICENCENAAKQGAVPIVQIKEKSLTQQIDNPENIQY